MNTFRWALVALIGGGCSIASALFWPEVGDPRARWTNEKSADYSQTNRDIHGLIHTLSKDAGHVANDPGHIHGSNETTDPRLSALELERAREHATQLRTELEAARQTPAGWHLLLGLVGGVLVVIGGVLAVAARRKS